MSGYCIDAGPIYILILDYWEFFWAATTVKQERLSEKQKRRLVKDFESGKIVKESLATKYSIGKSTLNRMVDGG